MGLLAPSGANFTTEGPRLDSLKVTDSAYGLDIPRCYGSVRVGGNVIWSDEITEVKTTTTQRSGGKGGGSSKQTTITYEYFNSFAVAFGEGPASELLRIWADGKLIFDAKNQSGVESKIDFVARFYQGTEDQLPDTLIVEKEGEQSAAFRGICYIMFDNLRLSDFGNRMPSITAEINFREELQGLIQNQGPSFSPNINDTLITYDKEKDRLYIPSSGNTEISVFSLSSLSKISSLPYYQTLSATKYSLLYVIKGGGIALIHALSGQVWYENLSITGSPAGGGALLSYTDRGNLNIFVGWESGATPGWSSYAGTEIYEDYKFITGGSSDDRLSFCRNTTGNKAYCGFVSTSQIQVYLLETSIEIVSGAYRPTIISTLIKTLVPSDVISGGSSFTKRATFAVYDNASEGVLFGVTVDSSHYIVKLDSEGTVLFSVNVPIVRTTVSGEDDTTINGGYWAYHNGSTKIIKINVTTGDVSDVYDGVNNFSNIGSGNQIYDDYRDSIYNFNSGSGSQLYQHKTSLSEADPVGVDEIVRDMASKVGLNPWSEIDVNNITAGVQGYIVDSRMTVKAALEPLNKLHFIDAVERDGRLVYVNRGQSPTITINEDDFIMLDRDNPNNYQERRIQESELPAVYSISFMDYQNDYQDNSVSSKRIRFPRSAILSENKETLAIAAAISADEAKQNSEKGIYTKWLERSKFEFQLATKYLYLDSSDVCNFSLNNGFAFRGRFNEADIGKDFSSDCLVVKENNGQYSSTATADGGTINQQSIPSQAPTQGFVIDSTLLLDVHDTLGTGLRVYYAANNFGVGTWTGCVLSKSIDATEWTDLLQQYSGVAWGTVTTTLGNPDSYWRTDNTNTLDVYMVTGGDELASVTNAQMLNGSNAAMLIKQNGEVGIIQFQNITDLGNDSYRFDTLLRGRRGTNTMDKDYSGTEYFIVLNSEDLEIFSLSLNERNLSRFYKSITIGQYFEEAEQTPFIHTGRDQKPYSPVQLTATNDMSNNIDFTWQRRTRIGGEVDMGDGGDGTVPLNEDSEAYELDIYFGGSIIRTVTGITSPSYEYTAADQTTDGFTAGSVATIQVDVYQISATVGRGFAGEFNIEVQ